MILFGVVAATALATTAFAQDVVKVNPGSITVKIDNENVRVFEAVLKPGQKEAVHSHPSTVVYVIAGGTMRNHPSGGKAVEATLKTGDVLYRDPITHWAENIGKTTMRLVIVELKR
jgi:quercetin dioxygenase-like cupin family protein